MQAKNEVSHGWRWICYQQPGEATERQHMQQAIAAPLGGYTGRVSLNRPWLLVEQGGFLYDRVYYGAVLPFWTER